MVELPSSQAEALPELSQQLASGNANNLTQQDIVACFAIRQRLREEPEDDTMDVFWQIDAEYRSRSAGY